MPIYEYICLECGNLFEELRPMSLADAPISCRACHAEHTSRKISLFSAHSEGRVVAGSSASCGSCATHHCSTCSSLN